MSLRRTVSKIDVLKFIGPLVSVSVHRLVLFFTNVYCFPDPSVNSVVFSVDHLSSVAVYEVAERNGMVCDCRLVLLCCSGSTDVLGKKEERPL